MKQQEFKEILEKEHISFEEKEDKIIVTKDNDGVDLLSFTSLPEGIIFNNMLDVDLNSLTSMPKGIEFNNGGHVFLRSLKSLSEEIEFENGGSVSLPSLKSMSKGIVFNNGWNVTLTLLTSLPKGTKFNNGGFVHLYLLTSLSEGIVFNNGDNVSLDSLTSLPEDTEFNNGGNVNLISLTSLPEGIEFNNGSDVNLPSLTSLPEGIVFNNGGDVNLKDETLKIKVPYIKRFKVEQKGDKVYLYKRVSHDFKTQEGTENETLWKIGTTVEHPNWNPTKEECGNGKFYACAFPNWCSMFRVKNNDKFIKIETNIEDLTEWTDHPQYPQNISFRKGKVLEEVN